MEFGEWLLHEMEQAGLSNSELARRAGVSHARVSQVLAGDPPGNKFLSKVAAVLGKSDQDVFKAAGVIRSIDKDSPTIRELLQGFNDLSDADQKQVLDLIRGLRMVRGQQRRSRTGESKAK